MLKRLKSGFPIFTHFLKDAPLPSKVKCLIYLDSAATSQKPKEVIQAEKEWYERFNANVHRGAYDLAENATLLFEQGRKRVAQFIGAKNEKNIVFTKGTTEAINLVAHAWGRRNLKKGDTILLTEMEHHANLVPWQILAKEKGLKIHYWPIAPKGELKMDGAEKLLSGVKLLALTHVSNVLGTINPIEKIITMAHKKGVPVLVDAAQSVPHMPMNVRKLNPDFLAFSGHKMLGPTGIGVLFVREERFAEMDPYQGGGEMIQKVTFEGTTFKSAPWKFEAGTQPLAQVYGLMAAIDYLEKIGMKNVQRHNEEVVHYAYHQLKKIPEVMILGPDLKHRGALISFTVKGIHPHDLATFLNDDGIAIRAGHHCAQPLHERLGIAASARASFHVYNDRSDVDVFIKSLKGILKKWQTYIKR